MRKPYILCSTCPQHPSGWLSPSTWLLCRGGFVEGPKVPTLISSTLAVERKTVLRRHVKQWQSRWDHLCFCPSNECRITGRGFPLNVEGTFIEWMMFTSFTSQSDTPLCCLKEQGLAMFKIQRAVQSFKSPCNPQGRDCKRSWRIVH